jgi:hypothetical protein
VKLIVAEVVIELEAGRGDIDWPLILPRPEGTTYYPDARVFVRTRPETPTWLNGMRLRRRGRALIKAYIGPT